MTLEDLRAQQLRRRRLAVLVAVGVAAVLVVWLFTATPSDTDIARGWVG